MGKDYHRNNTLGEALDSGWKVLTVGFLAVGVVIGMVVFLISWLLT